MKDIQGATEREFEEVWKELTLLQKRYVVARQNAETKADAAEEIGIAPKTVYNWNTSSDKVKRAVELMAERRLAGVRELLEEAAAVGALRLLDLVRHGNANVALGAIKYAINQADGKPTQKQKVDHSGGVNVDADLDDVMSSLTKAAEQLSDD